MIAPLYSLLIISLASYANCYSSLISMSTGTASITNYYQDFASCSCDLTPSLCDNYCCCDSLCDQASAWAASNLCLKTSSSIEISCGQSTRGFGAIQDLACVYTSNRGTIGYYYQTPIGASLSYPETGLFSSVATSPPNLSQSELVKSLKLGSTYSAANQYINTSTGYLFVPLPGAGGNCVPGLVNITTSGTFACKIIPTAQNCASLNLAYAGNYTICQKGDCSSYSSNSSNITIPSSTLDGNFCKDIFSGFNLSTFILYSSGQYTSQSTLNSSTIPSSPLNTQIVVSGIISSTTPSSAKSGNPGYLLGKQITINNGILEILDSLTGNCATSNPTATLSVPFNVKKTVTCPSPSPCSTSYYIDRLPNLTINKYAHQSTETVAIANNTKIGCKAQGYTINILYSMDGWMLDPQYYIVSAQISDTATPDGDDPTSKYLRFNWIYVDPATVSTPPQNNFYTYFSNLWLPLKQQFGMS